jgi:hypothetical protein
MKATRFTAPICSRQSDQRSCRNCNSVGWIAVVGSKLQTWRLSAKTVIAGSNRISDLNLVGVRRYTLFLQSRCGDACVDHETSVVSVRARDSIGCDALRRTQLRLRRSC